MTCVKVHTSLGRVFVDPLPKTEQGDLPTTNREVFCLAVVTEIIVLWGLLLGLGVAVASIILATLSLYCHAHGITPYVNDCLNILIRVSVWF